MPYSSGTWTAAASSWNPAVAGTAVSVTDWTTLLADISTGLSTCLLKDGSQTATASVPFAQGLSAGAASAFNVSSAGVITACAGLTVTTGKTIIGTASATGAGASDVLLPNNVYLRGANSTNANARALIATDSGNYCAVGDAAHNGTKFGNPNFVQTAADTYNITLTSSDASPRGMFVNYTGGAPNGVGNLFLACYDTGGERCSIRSNGGIANYSANNVNLSTREVKNSLRIYTDDELLKYEAFLEDVDFGIWKYNDQTHDDWNHGPTVEGVQIALRRQGLAEEEASLIDEFSEGKFGLVTEDLKNIALGSLVASNKRLRERVAALEAR